MTCPSDGEVQHRLRLGPASTKWLTTPRYIKFREISQAVMKRYGVGNRVLIQRPHPTAGYECRFLAKTLTDGAPVRPKISPEDHEDR